MTNDDEFFAEREDWSRRKHLILSYYLNSAIGKLRTASPDERVVILDGFAGRGLYKDGAPGSPVHVGELADKVGGWNKAVHLAVHNVEAKKQHFDTLEQTTEKWVKAGIFANHHARFCDILPSILSSAGSSFLFAFIDPYNPKSLPFRDIAPLLKRSGKTELLIVFFSHAVMRTICAVRPEARNTPQVKAATSKQLHEIFGGNAWERFLEDRPTAEDVLVSYMNEIARQGAASGYPSPYVCAQPITKAFEKDLKYHVIFFTRHLDGVRLMNNAFAKERGDVRSQKVYADTANTLFADAPDALDSEVGPHDLLLYVARQRGGILPFSELRFKAMTSAFGIYTDTQYARATRELLAREILPRLRCVAQVMESKRGMIRLEDTTLLAYE